MQTAIINCRVFSAEKVIEDGVILAEGGRIISVGEDVPPGAQVIDLEGLNISPGFIDIQINGGESHYFSDIPNAEALHDICDSSLGYATTHVLPCLISSPHEKILAAIESVKNFMLQYPNKGVLGMHLEGPFINPLKRGAHSVSVIRKPTTDELEEIIRHGKGIIRVMTIAPELFTDDQLDLLMSNDIILSAGHSMMTYEQAQYYFNRGIKLVTHLYNAMTQMGHREPGTVGAIFDNESVYAPIILDGAHCHYAAARIAFRIKKEKLFLISDAAFMGRQVKSFKSELLDAALQGEYYRNAEGNLAGAAISMQEAVQNAINHVGLPLHTAIQMATINVARAINMEQQLGKIEKGYPARFVTFNNDFSACNTLILS
jgi:N-acetylglucosamine-6-phosphate deacetylase